MAKVVLFHETGGPEVLRIEECESPKPGKREVVLKIHAVGLNRSESLYFRGEYYRKPPLPSRLGSEAVGTVVKVGAGLSEDLLGKQVATFPGFPPVRHGVLGEEAVVPA